MAHIIFILLIHSLVTVVYSSLFCPKANNGDNYVYPNMTKGSKIDILDNLKAESKTNGKICMEYKKCIQQIPQPERMIHKHCIHWHLRQLYICKDGKSFMSIAQIKKIYDCVKCFLRPIRWFLKKERLEKYQKCLYDLALKDSGSNRKDFSECGQNTEKVNSLSGENTRKENGKLGKNVGNENGQSGGKARQENAESGENTEKKSNQSGGNTLKKISECNGNRVNISEDTDEEVLIFGKFGGTSRDSVWYTYKVPKEYEGKSKYGRNDIYIRKVDYDDNSVFPSMTKGDMVEVFRALKKASKTKTSACMRLRKCMDIIPEPERETVRSAIRQTILKQFICEVGKPLVNTDEQNEGIYDVIKYNVAPTHWLFNKQLFQEFQDCLTDLVYPGFWV